MRTAALSAGMESGSNMRSERTGLLAGRLDRSFSLKGLRSTDFRAPGSMLVGTA